MAPMNWVDDDELPDVEIRICKSVKQFKIILDYYTLMIHEDIYFIKTDLINVFYILSFLHWYKVECSANLEVFKVIL